jgi:hypothetical protein
MNNVLKPLRTLFTAIGGALPAANPLHRGVFAVKKAAATEDELHVGLRDSSDVMQWRRMLTKTYADTLYADDPHTHTSTLTVSEGGTPVDATVGIIDFDASDFNITESVEDTVAVALAYGTSAGTPAEGNHTHAYVDESGDTMTGPLIIDVTNDAAFVVRDASDVDTFLVDTNGTKVVRIKGAAQLIGSDGSNVTQWTLTSDFGLGINNGLDIKVTSDSGSTTKFLVEGATGDTQIVGALNHDGTTVGFFGVAPATRPTTYSVTNLVTDRSYDANATTTAELADVLGTLIADLRTMGLVT